MPKGLGYSIILHVAILLLVFYGLPSLFKKKVMEDQVVTVEILPVSELTNVKTAKSKPKPPEPKKEEKPTPATPPKASQAEPEKPKPAPPPPPKPEPKVEKKPEIKESIAKPLVKPKEEKKVEKKEEKKTPEKKKVEEDPFDALVKNLEKPQPEEKKEEKKEDEPSFDDVANAISKSDNPQEYKPNVPMSVSDKDAIRNQVSANWTPPIGAKNAKNMVVTLKLTLAQDGTVKDVKIENQARYNTDAGYRAMADSAARAAYKASPLKNLPADKYQGGWDEIELNFDPSEMMY
jgi:outer membrane biosynthesis protein TonB